MASYIVVQVVGGLVACGVLAVIATGLDGFSIAGSGFAANGYGDLSPGGYSLLAGLVTEVVLTAVLLLVILGSVRPSLPDGFAPVAIGLSLTLIHLVSIPVTNTSVNPARSLAPALFAGGDHRVPEGRHGRASVVAGAEQHHTTKEQPCRILTSVS